MSVPLTFHLDMTTPQHIADWLELNTRDANLTPCRFEDGSSFALYHAGCKPLGKLGLKVTLDGLASCTSGDYQFLAAPSPDAINFELIPLSAGRVKMTISWNPMAKDYLDSLLKAMARDYPEMGQQWREQRLAGLGEVLAEVGALPRGAAMLERQFVLELSVSGAYRRLLKLEWGDFALNGKHYKFLPGLAFRRENEYFQIAVGEMDSDSRVREAPVANVRFDLVPHPGGKTEVRASCDVEGFVSQLEKLVEGLRGTPEAAPTEPKVAAGQQLPTWLPKKEKTLRRWHDAYAYIRDRLEDQTHQYEDGESNEPEPTQADLAEHLVQEMHWRPSAKTVGRIRKAGERGWI